MNARAWGQKRVAPGHRSSQRVAGGCRPHRGNSGWLPDVIAVSRRRHRWRLGAWQESLHRDLATLRDWPMPVRWTCTWWAAWGWRSVLAQFRRNHADIDLAPVHRRPAAVHRPSERLWLSPGAARPRACRVAVAPGGPGSFGARPGPGRALRVSRATNTRLRHSAVRTDFMDVMLMRRGHRRHHARRRGGRAVGRLPAGPPGSGVPAAVAAQRALQTPPPARLRGSGAT